MAAQNENKEHQTNPWLVALTVSMATFMEVMDTSIDRNALSAQDAFVQSSEAICTDLVAIYKALGGGWEVAERHL